MSVNDEKVDVLANLMQKVEQKQEQIENEQKEEALTDDENV